MDTNLTNQDQNESNAGAGMNDNSGAAHKAVRRNASHPGDASNAAGMRRDSQEEPHSQDGERGGPEDSGGRDALSR